MTILEPDTEFAGLLPGSESESFKLHAAETTGPTRRSRSPSQPDRFRHSSRPGSGRSTDIRTRIPSQS